MTKQDFELIARIVHTITDNETRISIARLFATLLSMKNPRFNSYRFLTACDAASPITRRVGGVVE